MAQVIWMPQSLEDIEEIRTKIAQSSERAAARFVVRMFTGAEQLGEFPELGRIVPRFNRRDVRELILGSHKLAYRIVGEDVEIIAVLYGAQEFYTPL